MNPAVVKRQNLMAVAMWQVCLGKEPITIGLLQLTTVPKEDTTRVNRCLPKLISRKVCCYWHWKFAQPPWFVYIREVNWAEHTVMANQIVPGFTLHAWVAPCSLCNGGLVRLRHQKLAVRQRCPLQHPMKPECCLWETTQTFWEVSKCWPRNGN